MSFHPRPTQTRGLHSTCDQQAAIDSKTEPPVTSTFPKRMKLKFCVSKLALVFTVALIFGVQTSTAQPVSTGNSPGITTPNSAGPRWSDLTPAQQSSLKPLAPTWDTLEAARKRKWIAVAQSYPRLTPAEQEKMQSRMVEWAALSPRERAVARLNFAETKKVPSTDRAANWDAYQALPAEDRQKLAAKANPPPSGAAIAPKQSTTGKVTPVPVTRHTPTAQVGNGSAVAPVIDRKTLLPQVQKPAKAASSPSS
ncbi:MAG: hypothetical protein CFE44_14930 [Burkholderiales bacterium PBB4]|nr:MAG: hypothetical protein CFE44_14930 [Burkholderiales bacterium PBB4]